MTAKRIYTLQIVGFFILVAISFIIPQWWLIQHEIELLVLVVLPLSLVAIWSTNKAHQLVQAENLKRLV